MARRRTRALIRAAATLALACAICGAAGYGYVMVLWAELPHAGTGSEVVFLVPRGTGPGRLSRMLASQGVVSRAGLFELYLRLRHASPRIRAGRYLLRDDLTPSQVLARIARVGTGGALRVTIPEGRNAFQIAALMQDEGIVQADDLLAAAQDPELLASLHVDGTSAEGYLFPDTYDLLPGTGADEVIRRLKANFDRRVAPLLSREAARIAALGTRAGVDRRGVLVLASLVEAEARLDAERPRVAAVFLNRLGSPTFHPRYLNSDPSVAYGCRIAPGAAPSCAAWVTGTGRITRAMLEDADNRYNTYRLPGLPPGPICNPGIDAIRAVLHPALTDELYFMARGDGSHAFARSLAEHSVNVQKYR